MLAFVNFASNDSLKEEIVKLEANVTLSTNA
jgi:hypothetical protein